MRAMSYTTFRRRYKPVDSAVLAPCMNHAHETLVPHHIAARFPAERVWTMIECGGKWYLASSFHFVNRTGDYVVCEVPHDFTDRAVLYF